MESWSGFIRLLLIAWMQSPLTHCQFLPSASRPASNDINSLQPVGHYYNRRSKWTLDKIMEACKHLRSFVCNPDQILSAQQTEILNKHLMEGAVMDYNREHCAIQLRVILIRDLDEGMVYFGGEP